MCILQCTIHSVDGEEETRTLALEDILVFATGANRVPPMGFPKKVTVQFDKSSIFPTASTCALEMYLPIQWATYEEFKGGMIEGIVSGAGFGKT